MTLYFWNNGSPRKAKITGSGNRQKLTMPDGTVRTGKIVADPDSDLYDSVTVGDMPGLYERAGPVTSALANDLITFTRTVVDVPLEQAQTAHKSKVKNKRNAVRDAGIEWQAVSGDPVYIVQTDNDSRRELDGEVEGLRRSGDTTTYWRMADNSFVELTDAEFVDMALAVRAHVKACFARQAVLDATIGAAANVDAVRAIDVSTGWPDHYEPES